MAIGNAVTTRRLCLSTDPTLTAEDTLGLSPTAPKMMVGAVFAGITPLLLTDAAAATLPPAKRASG